jgi:SagB-type dehydrogenase family enzyme
MEEPELETSARELDRTVEEHRDAAVADAFEVTIHEEISTDYAFEPDLLIDGPRERRVRQLTEVPALADDLRPVVAPSVRTWVGEDGAVRFRLDLSEPLIERDAGCTVMRRIVRDVSVAGNPAAVWRLIRQMDGQSTVAQVLSTTGEQRTSSENILSELAAAGVIDVSGRSMGRFLHWATRKGVLPAGGLSSDEVLQLATDGEYRTHQGTTRIPVQALVPDRLRGFHGLTRSRRSSRDYRALPLRRIDFDALLSTACGVTGTMTWSGREMRLRAYPSSGALYAVEIYPVVFRVEGLEPAVHHYRSNENELDVVRSGVDVADFVAAALPMEREMVAGAAAMICLAGSFSRHERKYGQGGYRMMVAESGHISQNLVLAATALGLSARPFGGVFDDLINQELGLDGEDEQFLLGVLVGHAGSNQGV